MMVGFLRHARVSTRPTLNQEPIRVILKILSKGFLKPRIGPSSKDLFGRQQVHLCVCVKQFSEHQLLIIFRIELVLCSSSVVFVNYDISLFVPLFHTHRCNCDGSHL